MSTRIIGIHGLATKPPEATLKNHWGTCLWNNIRKNSPTLSSKFADETDFVNRVFKLVYWANEIPNHLEDTPDWCFLIERHLQEYLGATNDDSKLHIRRDEISKLTKSKLTDVAAFLSRALKIQDDIIEKRFEEIRLYRGDQFIARNIRAKLEAALRETWNQGDDIILIAHSMGSLIAYDVLWELSHRSEKQDTSPGRIRLLITVGSPLGNTTIKNSILGDRYGPENIRYFPTCVDAWHNYSALGDVVCHDEELSDDYLNPMHKLGALPSTAHSQREYVNLFNAFVEPSGHTNPHSIYGYLVQPKIAKWLERLMIV